MLAAAVGALHYHRDSVFAGSGKCSMNIERMAERYTRTYDRLCRMCVTGMRYATCELQTMQAMEGMSASNRSLHRSAGPHMLSTKPSNLTFGTGLIALTHHLRCQP